MNPWKSDTWAAGARADRSAPQSASASMRRVNAFWNGSQMTYGDGDGNIYFQDKKDPRRRWMIYAGDKVTLQATPPIQALVKQVQPWRERTQVRLVVNSFDLADLTLGQRLFLKMTPPAREVLDAALPPDIDQPRSREERVEWFLASIYCTCKVGGDGCTGHFYTLASCNPNACGMPNHMRQVLAEKIDRGLTDRQIFEELLKHKPDVNAKDAGGYTPLYHAVTNYRLDMIDPLLAAGADITAASNDKQTPLQAALQNRFGNNNNDIAGKMLKQLKDVNAKLPSGERPLHFAARHGLKETVKKWGQEPPHVSDVPFVCDWV